MPTISRDIELEVVTRRAPLDGVMLEHADAHDPLVWSHHGDTLVAAGTALRLQFNGPERFSEASRVWDQLVQHALVSDEVGTPASGLIAFGTFAFADHSPSTSVLRIPRVVWGVRDGVSFVTQIRVRDSEDTSSEPSVALGVAPRVTWTNHSDAEPYMKNVREALTRIRGGLLNKIVLARSITGQLSDGDLRMVVRRLMEKYPSTWVFAVDGLIGASPETLLAVRAGRARVQVLAGTRASEPGADTALLASIKDREEHDIAVLNVRESLARAGITATTSGQAHALELPEMWHLATDLALENVTSSLDVVAQLHPTAAVGGAPTEAAVKAIADIESIDRGRYAGPVGWVDGRGNAEWAIALRCAQFGPGNVTAFAGGGIVAHSDPALEFAETELKLRAMRSVL